MTILFYILTTFIGIIVLLLLLGLILPKDRIARRVVNFSSDLQTVWDAITNNEDYDWRSDISKIEILDDGNSWIEYSSKDNSSISFKITKKNIAKEYNFSMENPMFTGQFMSKFESSSSSGPKVEFIESISIKNPIIKPLSYLFFNVQAFQDKYISDLKSKLNE